MTDATLAKTESEVGKWQPTEVDLRGMTKHLVYEVCEYRKAVQELARLKGKPEWNPRLESALLHFRVLREFFMARERKSGYDNVLARDYIRDWDPINSQVFKGTKADIDKRIAHLSVRRLAEDFDWPLDDMNNGIENLVSQFKRLLSPEHSELFSALVAQTSPATATFTGMTCRTDSGPPASVIWAKEQDSMRS